jgi:hypothetical protein
VAEVSWTFAPGEPLVLHLDLTDPVAWECDVPLTSFTGREIEARAVFTADQNDAVRRNGVWAGRASSPWGRYQIK